MDALSLAKRLKSEHRSEMSDWSPETLAVFLNCKHRCAYCGKDVLAHDATYYYGCEVDHLLPIENDTI